MKKHLQALFDLKMIKRIEKKMKNKILHGDVLSMLRSFPNDYFDGVITDPPYSSGGRSTADRQKSTANKYTSTKEKCSIKNFEGDNKDQRSWTNWCAEWLKECRRVVKDGTPICVFCDWRQIPSLTDAMQWADIIWRGIAVWDKKNSRPQPGHFRQQCEFIVWGTKGNTAPGRKNIYLPGIFSHSYVNNPDRLHQTQKSLELMREIVKIVESGGTILDPFAGSGTTCLAAKLEGYDYVGVEISEHYAKVAENRLRDC